jgi:hypothetical protein
MKKEKRKILFLINTSLEAEIAYLVSKDLHKKTKYETLAFHLRYEDFNQKFPDLIRKMKESDLVFISEKDYPNVGPVKTFQMIKPDIVITTNDIDPMYHTYLIASKFLNIPTLLVQPGIIGEQPFTWQNLNILLVGFSRMKRIITDYQHIWLPLTEMKINFFSKIIYISKDLWSRFFRNHGSGVWGHKGCTKISVEGDFLKELLIKQGISREKIVVTGQPRYDLIYKKKRSEGQFIKNLLLIKKKKKIVLYLPNALYQHLMCSKETYYNMHYDTIKTCQQLPDVHIIVKPHPEETVEYYQEIINEAKSNALVYNGTDLYGIIKLADLVITGISTTIMQSLLLDKPVVMIDIKETSYFPTEHEYIPYVTNGVAFGIYHGKDYDPVIKDALYNLEKRKNLANNRKEFMYHHAYLQDGKASERVADLILSMIESGKELKTNENPSKTLLSTYKTNHYQ